LLPAIPSIEEAKLIAEQAAEAFTSGAVDAVEIIGTKFISMLASKVQTISYLPATDLNTSGETIKDESHPELHKIVPIRLFEPTIVDIMTEQLVPKYLQNVIYQSLLEASAAELAARMNAMTNASNNARDLISSLTLVYNKARQSSITQDLLEIVGGAEALKG